MNTKRYQKHIQERHETLLPIAVFRWSRIGRAHIKYAFMNFDPIGCHCRLHESRPREVVDTQGDFMKLDNGGWLRASNLELVAALAACVTPVASSAQDMIFQKVRANGSGTASPLPPHHKKSP